MAGFGIFKAGKTTDSKADNMGNAFYVAEEKQDGQPANSLYRIYSCDVKVLDDDGYDAGTKVVFATQTASELRIDAAGNLDFEMSSIKSASKDVDTAAKDMLAKPNEGYVAVQDYEAIDFTAPIPEITALKPTPTSTIVQAPTPAPTIVQAPTPAPRVGPFDENGYVFAYSSSRLIPSTELDRLQPSGGYTKLEILGYARNEIFARHGYKFKFSPYYDHYNQYGWYRTKQLREDVYDSLSKTEIANVEAIQQYELSLEKHVSWPYIEASSEYDEEVYTAAKAIDGKVDTAWFDCVGGGGIGETIKISTDGNRMVRGLRIINGYAASEQTYYENCRIKRVRIYLPDGTDFEEEFSGSNMGYQLIGFSPARNIDHCELEILEVYPGEIYNFACISELTVREI